MHIFDLIHFPDLNQDRRLINWPVSRPKTDFIVVLQTGLEAGFFRFQSMNILRIGFFDFYAGFGWFGSDWNCWDPIHARRFVSCSRLWKKKEKLPTWGKIYQDLTLSCFVSKFDKTESVMVFNRPWNLSLFATKSVSQFNSTMANVSRPFEKPRSPCAVWRSLSFSAFAQPSFCACSASHLAAFLIWNFFKSIWFIY